MCRTTSRGDESPPTTTRSGTRRNGNRLSASHISPLLDENEFYSSSSVEKYKESTHQPCEHLHDKFSWSWSGRTYIGGYALLLAHLTLINFGLIDRLGIMGTGTMTVISWFIGWCGFLYYHGAKCRALRIEFILLCTQLFVLAVGAGAFSRFYYGWVAGHDIDLFQSLSVVFFNNDPMMPDWLKVWWQVSATDRFSGFGWWICEFVDPIFHQAPFLVAMYMANTVFTFDKIHREVSLPLIAAATVIGPCQRFFWDFCVCGELVCDGPYAGYLMKISPLEQVFWHTAPGLLFCAWLKYKWLERRARAHKMAKGKATMKKSASFVMDYLDDNRDYSVSRTLAAIAIWMAAMVISNGLIRLSGINCSATAYENGSCLADFIH